MMLAQNDIISIAELTAYIKKKFTSDTFLSNLWVRGEISNFIHHSSGHMYFTLKDDASRIKAVMFIGNARTLTFQPHDGMKVITRGYVSIYERSGEYQFYAQEILPDGIGQLYLAYEQLKKKLELEGLFRVDTKKTLPKYPRKIGIVTSATGAAIRDIITTIKRRYPLVELIVAPVAVQGADAAPMISKAISQLNQLTDVDIIIVGRGGGSIEELWAFNEEVVARAIHQSQVPVVSAVGHQTDYTIADFVADVRAATPTAAAEIAVPNIVELSKSIDNFEQRINFYFANYLAAARLKLRNLLASAAFKHPEQRIIEEQQRINNLHKRLIREVQVANRGYAQLLLSLEKQLVALSPFNVLNRGYAIVYNAKGEILSSVQSVHNDDQILTRLKDGQIASIVRTVEGEKDVEN